MYETHHDRGRCIKHHTRRSRPARLKKFVSVVALSKVTIGDVDLPAFALNGIRLHPGATSTCFPSVWRGPRLARSGSWNINNGAPHNLSLGSDGRAVLSSPMVEQSVVPRS